MYIPVTAEEKTNKKNDVKARSLLLMALLNEHQLTFSKYPDAKSMFAAIEIRFGRLRTNSLKMNWKMDLMVAILSEVECRAPRSKEGQFRNQDNTRKQGNNKDKSSKAMLALDGVGFDWSDMAEEQVQTNMALMSFSDSEASKDLDQLLRSQITEKSKKGLGYSAVPPPYPLIYNRPKKLDLSYSGLDEFKEPEFKGYGPEKVVKSLIQKRHYYNGRPRAVNTARFYSGQVNVVRVKGVNVVKSSAYWVWRPTKPNGALLSFKRHNYINDEEIQSRNGLGLSLDFKEFDRGDVAFGGGAHMVARITGQGYIQD
ncbi:hypothetical protein Tco_0371195 [Tanacetum coccineum]